MQNEQQEFEDPDEEMPELNTLGPGLWLSSSLESSAKHQLEGYSIVPYREKASRCSACFWMLVSCSTWGINQGSPCQEALGEGEDLKLQQMASSVFSFNI